MRQQQSIQAIGAFSSALRIADPNARKTALTNLMPGLGMDPNSDSGQTFLKDQMKYTDDTLNSMAQSLQQAGVQGIDSKMIGQMYQNDPASFYNMLFQLQYRKQGMQLLQGLPGTDTGQQGQTQDLTGGQATVGGGGTTTSGDMGTAGAGAQPSSTTAAVGGAPAPPLQQPAAGQPAVGQPAAVAGQPTVHDVARANPQLQGASSPAGNVLLSGNDPVVRDYNRRMKAAQAIPGEIGTQVFNTLKDQRDNYIAQQHYATDQWWKALDYGIARGHLSIDAGQLAVANRRLNWDMSKPLTPEGQAVYDANHGFLSMGGDPNRIAPAAGTGAGGGTIGGGALTTGSPTDNAALAGPRAGKTAPDIGQGAAPPPVQAVTGATGATGAAATPKLVQGDPPKDSMPVTDAAIFKSLGLLGDEKLYKGPDGNYYMKTPTETSLPDKSQQGNAQIRLDANQTGLNLVNNLLAQLDKHPTNFAMIGDIKELVQNTYSKATDLSKYIGFDLPQFYNPQLAQNEQAQEALSLLVTNELYSGAGGGGGMGGYTETMKKSDEMTKISGNTSVEEARAKLLGLRDFFTNAVNKYKGQANVSGANVQSSGAQTDSAGAGGGEINSTTVPGISQFKVLPGGDFKFGPTIPNWSIAILRQNPQSWQVFDSHFGKGAAKAVLGQDPATMQVK
jgi:hypothetical protein